MEWTSFKAKDGKTDAFEVDIDQEMTEDEIDEVIEVVLLEDDIDHLEIEDEDLDTKKKANFS